MVLADSVNVSTDGLFGLLLLVLVIVAIVYFIRRI